MKNLLAIAAIFCICYLLHGEYTRPDCGTAHKCGPAIHDLLHSIVEF